MNSLFFVLIIVIGLSAFFSFYVSHTLSKAVREKVAESKPAKSKPEEV